MKYKYLFFVEHPKIYKIYVITVPSKLKSTLKFLERSYVHIKKVREYKVERINEIYKRYLEIKKILSRYFNLSKEIIVSDYYTLEEVEAYLKYIESKIKPDLMYLLKIEDKFKEIKSKIVLLNKLLEKFGNINIKEINYVGNSLFRKLIVLYKDIPKDVKDRSGIEHIYDKFYIIYGRINLLDYLYELEAKGFLRFYNFSEVNNKTIKEAINYYNSMLNSLKDEYNEVINKIKKFIEENIDIIARIEFTLKKLSLIEKVYYKAKSITLIEGFIDERMINYLKKNEKELEGIYYITDPKPGEKVPTKLQYPSQLTKSFSNLTKMFGIPSYYELDPTPFISLAFPIFFGLMLSDAFYGIVLIVASLFLYKKKDLREFSYILLLSGISATIIGFLSGSFMGNLLEKYLNIHLPKLFNPTAFNLIKLSIVIGLFFVGLSRLLAAIVSYRQKDYGGLLENLGILILEIFGSILLANKMFNVMFPSLVTYLSFYLTIGGLILITLGNVISNGPTGLFFVLMSLSGLLGDVLSFLRIAALFLSTGYVANSFNKISFMIPLNIFTIPVIIIVLLLFHLFNLVSSSLSAFAHSLRLLFVELLPKFYEGRGITYTPFKLSEKIIVKI